MSPSPDEALHGRALDELASIALDEPVAADVAEHVAGCVACQQELRSLRATVGAGRSVAQPAGAAPPTSVWTGIERAVAPPARSPQRRLPWVAALVAVLVAGAALGGWALGRRDDARPSGAAQAALSAQPGTAAAASGTAVMRRSDDGFELEVRTTGLPAPVGYYEVWLYDPAGNRMVAVGTLGPDERGTFTMPAGLDTAAFRVVDVSLQRFDGNPVHQRSVLRGPLRPT